MAELVAAGEEEACLLCHSFLLFHERTAVVCLKQCSAVTCSYNRSAQYFIVAGSFAAFPIGFFREKRGFGEIKKTSKIQ